MSEELYRAAWERCAHSPEEFWLEQAKLVDWIRPPQRALDEAGAPIYRWFPDATLNTCANAVDRHVAAGHGDRPAIIYDSPVSSTQCSWTYRELLGEVKAAAGMLSGLGVSRGDRVVIYMPMVPEAVVAMLACARLGAVHSVVFGGFAPAELATRIDDARPRVVVAASCGIEPKGVVEYKPLLDAALALTTHQPDAVVLKQRAQCPVELTNPREHDWDNLLTRAVPCEQPVEVKATDPLYILYTSGTTGKPKGVVRDNGGHAVALTWALGAVFDVNGGDVLFTASDVGWVVGHSFIVYAPLLRGATTVLFEGKPVGTPDASTFWRVAADHRVKAIFTAPTAIRAIKREDPLGHLIDRHDLSSLKTLFLAGERLDPDTYAWAGERLGVPVVDNWWQTETGWPVAANLRGLAPMPLKAGSPSVPVPGYEVHVLDAEGARLPPGNEGAICLKLPLPPGTLQTLWQADNRYVSAYLTQYEGYYLTGDGGYLDDDGYLYVMGRTDDVINVAGHRLSTGAMEAVLAAHPAIAECAVIGVRDELKGQVPRGLVVLKAGTEITLEQLSRELVARVREEIGAVAVFKDVRVVDALPKTRSGKILRKTMRQLADGDTPDIPPTIEDPLVLRSIAPQLQQ
ncbi:propionyl-CoA synthetase [Amycolatopsis acidicola]|uniref:Propionyl-CoA synthetase n=1 Tax=Amycolatopsis acidicola TaxID=2596893 RepID=A0A5N0VDD6_9PSEU|nr:AMP-binding protein [Amycolatopsis acidicola]KAA9164367.1 propionyl-CoA synthetase [Amycolatopsis acidicola]